MRLRYILAVLLSLTVVYAGAGVSIVHYCCARCEMAQACCMQGCEKCDKSHYKSHHNTPDNPRHNPHSNSYSKQEISCKDEGCTATFYKVDLVKYSCENPVIAVPVLQLLCEVLSDFKSLMPAGDVQEVAYKVPPHPVSPRQYLALYSVFII